MRKAIRMDAEEHTYRDRYDSSCDYEDTDLKHAYEDGYASGYKKGYEDNYEEVTEDDEEEQESHPTVILKSKYVPSENDKRFAYKLGFDVGKDCGYTDGANDPSTFPGAKYNPEEYTYKNNDILNQQYQEGYNAGYKEAFDKAVIDNPRSLIEN